MKLTHNNTGQSSINNLSPELAFDFKNNISELPTTIRLLPMAELNSFPQLISSIAVEEPMSRLAVNTSCAEDQYLALMALNSLDVDLACLTADDFYPVGVAAQIIKVWESDEGLLKVMVHGLSRITIDKIIPGDSYCVQINHLPEEVQADDSLRPLILEAKRLYTILLELIPGMPFNMGKFQRILDDQPVLLADLMMASLPLKPVTKVEFLCLTDLKARLLSLLENLNIEVFNRQTGRAISQRIEDNLDKKQKELHLREQLKAIQAELGEDESEDADDLTVRLGNLNLPDEIRQTADRELKRLKQTPTQSAEYGVIHHYLEWITDLPWDKSSEEINDLNLARTILERDHYGLTQVKKRLLEFLAVHKLTQNQKSPILCLTGPPGVGKTSLGRSIAEALGRKFVRLSLGGLKDEAEIRGHRRTYVGSRPGRLITGLKRAGVNNPVFLLDELDKMPVSNQGDPASALLEALDPEQNDTFTDHYLEIPFDLSKVLFILTANFLEQIPPPMRDRLEVIEVGGYTVEEKTAIARNHIWERELKRHGLAPDELSISDEAIKKVITAYTWEAGCRGLCRQLDTIIRSRAVDKAEDRPLVHLITTEELPDILGPPRHQSEFRENLPRIGVVTGLAWTAAGGDIMFIEAVAMNGQGDLAMTGQLGEVMKESALAAISYVRSRADDWYLDPEWFQNHDLHVHLPQGAIPKDGPSAGISLATAIASLASGHSVRSDLAMTGEISLRGLILPVGGLKEKLLAAKRAGISTVIIPERNQPELAEIPEGLTDGLNIIQVKNMDQVLQLALIGEKNMTSEKMEENVIADGETEEANKTAFSEASNIGIWPASEACIYRPDY